MKRSDLLRQGATWGLIAAGLTAQAGATPGTKPNAPILPLDPPSDGVPAAFLLSDMAVMIDLAGPWEVFQDAAVTGRTQPAFKLYTVAESAKAVQISGGATILPNFTIANAPAPKVVVVPAQSDATEAVKQWLVATAKRADLVMSVCTGAFILAQAGLLDGYTVTTHHSGFATLAMRYPNVTVKRGVRFVDNGHIATSAGLSAGIDLALHVVARYYGMEAARATAYDMEYRSSDWLDANNAAYLKPPLARAGDAVCPVCWMEVDPKTSPVLSYDGTKYYFCAIVHENLFAGDPQRFLNA